MFKCRSPGLLGRVWFSPPGEEPGNLQFNQQGVKVAHLLLSLRTLYLCMKTSGTLVPDSVPSLLQPVPFHSTPRAAGGDCKPHSTVGQTGLRTGGEQVVCPGPVPQRSSQLPILPRAPHMWSGFWGPAGRLRLGSSTDLSPLSWSLCPLTSPSPGLIKISPDSPDRPGVSLQGYGVQLGAALRPPQGAGQSWTLPAQWRLENLHPLCLHRPARRDHGPDRAEPCLRSYRTQ